MIFLPYMDDGYQCKMNTSSGIISVRFNGAGLFADNERPYEVWYPTEDAPNGYQTADDIWDYILKLSH